MVIERKRIKPQPVRVNLTDAELLAKFADDDYIGVTGVMRVTKCDGDEAQRRLERLCAEGLLTPKIAANGVPMKAGYVLKQSELPIAQTDAPAPLSGEFATAGKAKMLRKAKPKPEKVEITEVGPLKVGMEVDYWPAKPAKVATEGREHYRATVTGFTRGKRPKIHFLMLGAGVDKTVSAKHLLLDQMQLPI